MSQQCWMPGKRCSAPTERGPGDRGFESLYPSKGLLAGRLCRLAEPGLPTGSSLRSLCFEHLEGTCTSAGRPITSNSHLKADADVPLALLYLISARSRWCVRVPVRCGWSAKPLGPNLPAGGLVMNQREFEADLRRQGYLVFYGGLQPGMVNPDHAHDWDGRVMVIGGEITLTRDGKAETFRVGDSCAVAAGEVHAEHVGPQGVAYIAGRRNAVG